MGFRMINPKRVRKVKTKNSQEVLSRLEEYLESAAVTGEPVEILCGFWEDQQNAITYQELRQTVTDGEISQETLQLWTQDYSVLVANRLSKLWTDAIIAGSAGQPVLDGLAFEINTQTPGILNWLSERGAEFVTASTQEQKDSIAALLTKKMRDSHTVDELSRLIRPCIGLTERDTKAAARLYDSIVSNLKKEHPRMKAESIRRKAMDAAQKYAERKHRARAYTIAQTESAFAYNRGADEGIRQAQSQNLIGKVRKRWCTSGDDGVCGLCASLDGVEIEMDESFGIGGKELFPGQKRLPPAHPRCGCAVEYIEDDTLAETGSTGRLGTADSGHAGEPVPLTGIGEINPEKVDDAIHYYNNEIRNREYETAVVIDKDGRVFYASGGTSGITFSGVDLSGAYITHNHPVSNGILSFGEEDFYFLKAHQDVACLYCVNRDYDYSVKVLKDISGVVYNEIYLEALFRHTDDAGFEIQHETMEVLKERGYIEYARTKHTT